MTDRVVHPVDNSRCALNNRHVVLFFFWYSETDSWWVAGGGQGRGKKNPLRDHQEHNPLHPARSRQSHVLRNQTDGKRVN